MVMNVKDERCIEANQREKRANEIAYIYLNLFEWDAIMPRFHDRIPMPNIKW